MWEDYLKEAGLSIHIVATGAGAGVQKLLWEVPGSSAYLSGASFPYAQEEQEELLGFMPEHFCSEEAAIDLASAAYMKAYRFGGKKPIGVGVTASVASTTIHRGDHRFFICVMTDDKVLASNMTLDKGVGAARRAYDGNTCDIYTKMVLHQALNIDWEVDVYDVSEKAKAQFFKRPYFTAAGKRLPSLVPVHHAIMPGAFNPPHDGHYGMADEVTHAYGREVVFNTTINPPHKTELTVQECLKRAKLLQGKNRLFTQSDPFYIDKARNYPKTPLVVGADALQRLFDPKWGLDVAATLKEFKSLGATFYVSGRTIDGKFVSGWDAVKTMPDQLYSEYYNLFVEMPGRWDISSTELRNKVK
jgi:nicotinic acid mononucleotide adenylyltransferase